MRTRTAFRLLARAFREVRWSTFQAPREQLDATTVAIWSFALTCTALLVFIVVTT